LSKTTQAVFRKTLSIANSKIDLQTRLKELACGDSSRIRIRIRLQSEHGAHDGNQAVDTTCGSEAARTDPSQTRHAAIGV
jgi:hypothetical protein